MTNETQRIDIATVVGLGMLLMPLLTMWHEIGGHAAACAVQGGKVATIGAFYVDCDGLEGLPRVVVAIAGVAVDCVLALLAFALWRGARSDLARLVLWLTWVTKAFVAAGYFCFSGATGVGDLGPGDGGGIGPLPLPFLWRAGELVIGIAAYVLLVRAAIRTLTAMLGDSPATVPARRTIAHGYYATIGCAAVLVGLLNPLGIFITIMSAAASSFGGNAGMISVGFTVPSGATTKPFVIARNWPIIVAGAVVLAGFGLVLGPSEHFR
ncbi:hypothetical protein QH494_00320 [Sphingomonas sp. AR_OL41]|uniref:hypothetical protein n=1 Tax=Sphingomonas sp. AR_OL41 TaxID=3042729 RepID=UPI002480A885|nr:hypothetical protein [Sphingomonas sp. AR_OL41]MDH7970617.1 hypothetical protein [Sphingomonas sp. AR_OL41]